MDIRFDAQNKIFQIHTQNTTYMMGILDDKYLMQLYYGKRLEDSHCRYLLRTDETEKEQLRRVWDEAMFYTTSAFEYPVAGIGDSRDTCLRVRSSQGHRVCKLFYDSYRIFDGKPALKGMPATFPGGTKAQTLEITMVDPVLSLKILLRYSIFEDSDAIIKSVVAVNEGGQKLYLEKILSTCLDMDNEEYSVSTLHGDWGRERNIVTRPLSLGRFSVAGICGRTSHENHPFMMLTGKNANQKQGDVYGMNFVYSGNFIAEAEVNEQDMVRMSMGIHPDGFQWVLDPGASFETPEAVLVYSSEGIGGMTRCFHNLYRNHLIRSPWLHKKRPILINNWEATYFNFDDEKLVDIARTAKELGIEMLVMDDGWFGNRNYVDTGLGDWFVNEDKLKGGLGSLVERINAVGMKFGIWFEPEMISPGSRLYEEHPDWAMQVPGRPITKKRYQYVLDLTRQDVVDYVYEMVASVLRQANIEYVKWDMNRHLTDAGSVCLDAEHMGEFYHRYVLGVYQMQERLIKEFPNLLLENCCGGGGRFDPGMLYYSPQIWTSDDMDPVERLAIQEGTALVYPLSTMGAHVCVCPNHSTGRTTPLTTRANVALSGTFGYELDVTMLSEEEKELAASYNRKYHEYNDIYREGDYYRIASSRENRLYDCWQVVSKDKSETLVTFVQTGFKTRFRSHRLVLEGLDEESCYQLVGTEQVYSGEALMKAGYLQNMLKGDYESRILHFKKI